MRQNDLLYPIAGICKHSGLNFLCRPFYGGLGLVLMFHRFTNQPERAIDRSGIVSDKFFEKLLAYIRLRGQEIIFLRDVPRALAEKKRFICLTFDDGYRDNAEIALPVLQKYNAPATIFVPSGVLSRSLDAWWLQVEEIARTRPDPSLAYTEMIAKIDRSPEVLNEIRMSCPVSQAEINERYFMNASEVQKIARDPLIDIGGHTLTHPFLKTLSEEEAYREIRQNKKDLETLTQRQVETFAYPYGNSQACGSREFELTKRAGYKVAVTTRDGNVMAGHRHHLTALPRYSVRGFLESLKVFDMQKSGAYRALRSRFGSALVTE